MKNLNKRIIPKICLLAGICLIAIGVVVLASWQWNIHSSVKNIKSYVQTLENLTPTPQGAVLQERKDNTMPILSADGTDFVGILEMPRFNSALPVCANWGKITKYPCQFSGSVYNRTLQIGATTQKGQYDFYREISVGDSLIFTDMEGNRYTYAVTNLRYEKHANKAELQSETSDLTLFIKNIYAFEYLIISCNAL
jgi:hypothetical protein